MTENEQESIPLKERLSKFISFVDYFQISSAQIWDHQSTLHLQEFADRLEKKFGYKASIAEMSAFLLLSKQEPPMLSKNMFCQFGLWTNEKEKIKKKKIQRQSQRNKQNKDVRFTVNTFDRQNEQSNCKSRMSHMKKKKRQVRVNEELQGQILENILDKKWDYLTKIGEMNNWMKQCGNQEQNLNVSQMPKENTHAGLFKVKDQGNEMLIFDENSEILPFKVFDLKYDTQRKKNIKEEKKKNNMKGTVMMIVDDKQSFNKAKLQEKISLRDQELNYVLLEIMKMKNTLELQNQIFSECQINN